jgi:hypothetical protein
MGLLDRSARMLPWTIDERDPGSGQLMKVIRVAEGIFI